MRAVWDKQKKAAYDRRRYVANREKILEATKRWNKSNKERCKEYSKAWDLRNRDKRRKAAAEYRKKFPEKVKSTRKRWCRNHPETYKLLYSGANRRRYGLTRTSKVATDIDTCSWYLVCCMFDFRCAYCNLKRKLTIDHVVPLSLGGLHDLSNVVPACLSCNTSKNNKTPDQWINQCVLELSSPART